MQNHNQAADLMEKFNLSNDEMQLIAEAGLVLSNQMDNFVAQWYTWLEAREEFDLFFGSNPINLKRVQYQQKLHWQTFFQGYIDEDYIQSRRQIGAVHARINLPNDIYFAGMNVAFELLSNLLRTAKSKHKELNTSIHAIGKLIFIDSYLVIDEITRIQNERISESTKAMMEMSTPVTPIWEGILLLPLLGIIDSMRTQDIMNKTLLKISETRAKVFVIDISGVATVDTAVANQLIKITKATQLMGCESIISGISPGIARTIVELGVNVGEVKTTSTLRDAFEIALRLINVQINAQ